MTESKPERHLAHLTWNDIDALDKHSGVVVLPIGAVEQHGPHLPTLTDTLIASGLLEAALERLPADVPAWALPAMSYGKSSEHIAFPGTISLSANTLMAVLEDIAVSVRRAGFRRLAFLNGHGGNTALLNMIARDIRVETGLMCFCLQPSYNHTEIPLDEREARFGLHGGEIETSLVLALRPELVHMDRATVEYPDFPETDSQLFFYGPASLAWLSEDWSESGLFGDGRRGSAEKGQKVIEILAEWLAAVIADISTFEVGR